MKLISHLMLAGAIIGAAHWLRLQPTRIPGPQSIAVGHATQVPVGKLRAWRLSAPDARFGGLSALAHADGRLIALTDSGVVLRFDAPRAPSQPLPIAFHELPGGPGSPTRKSARDSESLLADSYRRGWWVGFENRHSLWLFDARFDRVLASQALDVDWPVNKGAEALAAVGDGAVMALPELGGRVVGGGMTAPPWVADATRLADGRLVLLVRRPTLAGFASEVRIAPGGGKPARRFPLDLAPLDNVEGIAAETLPGGRQRLWIVSDDNFRPWMRTLLVALDLPQGS